MYTHVMVGTDDLDASRRFYDATFEALGGKPGQHDSANRLLYLHKGSAFMVTKPIDGRPAAAANGGTIGFAAGTPDVVLAWHLAGVANEGVSVEDAPGERVDEYGRRFVAYLQDPSGNKLCAVCRMPAAEVAGD